MDEEINFKINNQDKNRNNVKNKNIAKSDNVSADKNEKNDTNKTDALEEKENMQYHIINNEKILSINKENKILNNEIESLKFNNNLQNINQSIFENPETNLRNLFVIEELIVAYNKFDDNMNKKEIIRGILQNLSNE